VLIDIDMIQQMEMKNLFLQLFLPDKLLSAVAK
jgi:hypothetical protein